MPDATRDDTGWKQVLFEYVNTVNEALLRGEDGLLREIPDTRHRSRLAARLHAAAHREAELGIKPVRSEVRARIERRHAGERDTIAHVALHFVRSYEQKGLTWQEERVERERVRFVRSSGDWRLDGVEPLAYEGFRDTNVEQPDEDPVDGDERRSAMPSVPYLNPAALNGRKSRVYAAGESEGAAYAYAGYRRGTAYRRDAAVAYAERWWNESNPAYEIYEVNCTNYVSQCLFAGRAPMNYTGRRESGWWYKGLANGREMWSYSWAVADSLQRYLSQPRSFGLRAEVMDSPDGLRLGDVICYDWNASGRFGHNTIVTAFAPDGTPLVNANTVSSRHRYWDYRDSYAWTGRTRYRFFHIADEF